ncbi:hypothetical protein CU664_17155 [Pseudomonas syringae pv. actinidifoliorum]|nr:hypothetical protein [Pseudomonas syringae pv. actinidifoliorum]NAT64890.1 hypothetical protein [Pseudomonas syringae pv. actinidifoliorum]
MIQVSECQPGADAERIFGHVHRSSLQRGNAVGDAPRHRFALRRRFGTGREASRTACRRRASAR